MSYLIAHAQQASPENSNDEDGHDSHTENVGHINEEVAESSGNAEYGDTCSESSSNDGESTRRIVKLGIYNVKN